mgnify:CR=1 FL=1
MWCLVVKSARVFFCIKVVSHFFILLFIFVQNKNYEKLVYLLFALLVSIGGAAQEVVFSSGDFTIEDAMKMIENDWKWI